MVTLPLYTGVGEFRLHTYIVVESRNSVHKDVLFGHTGSRIAQLTITSLSHESF